jgi:hypothetical protein
VENVILKEITNDKNIYDFFTKEYNNIIINFNFTNYTYYSKFYSYIVKKNILYEKMTDNMFDIYISKYIINTNCK